MEENVMLHRSRVKDRGGSPELLRGLQPKAWPAGHAKNSSAKMNISQATGKLAWPIKKYLKFSCWTILAFNEVLHELKHLQFLEFSAGWYLLTGVLFHALYLL